MQDHHSRLQVVEQLSGISAVPVFLLHGLRLLAFPVEPLGPRETQNPAAVLAAGTNKAEGWKWLRIADD